MQYDLSAELVPWSLIYFLTFATNVGRFRIFLGFIFIRFFIISYGNPILVKEIRIFTVSDARVFMSCINIVIGGNYRKLRWQSSAWN